MNGFLFVLLSVSISFCDARKIDNSCSSSKFFSSRKNNFPTNSLFSEVFFSMFSVVLCKLLCKILNSSVFLSNSSCSISSLFVSCCLGLFEFCMSGVTMERRSASIAWKYLNGKIGLI